ncbi:uncharacterized protein K452DRAFT_111650 [Aplosporella prunicola CBS 121167]|uniref:Uncharacterized protein n=1 Tax=Aplosporella prunicola CBS 121167 TaxID=1176127 RepID=A0A6A6B235_9PEZI|nr:uncharacterized protein K452DRAFT_111650 [Aplosporella prunicola CBS 121167]KAF2137325.1 hypothetical protein K452DRAFT_111650 [Aplosporella prunicola CBS 121167]
MLGWTEGRKSRRPRICREGLPSLSPGLQTRRVSHCSFLVEMPSLADEAPPQGCQTPERSAPTTGPVSQRDMTTVLGRNIDDLNGSQTLCMLDIGWGSEQRLASTIGTGSSAPADVPEKPPGRDSKQACHLCLIYNGGKGCGELHSAKRPTMAEGAGLAGI